jgi:hypothetical protein
MTIGTTAGGTPGATTDRARSVRAATAATGPGDLSAIARTVAPSATIGLSPVRVIAPPATTAGRDRGLLRKTVAIAAGAARDTAPTTPDTAAEAPPIAADIPAADIPAVDTAATATSTGPAVGDTALRIGTRPTVDRVVGITEVAIATTPTTARMVVGGAMIEDAGSGRPTTGSGSTRPVGTTETTGDPVPLAPSVRVRRTSVQNAGRRATGRTIAGSGTTDRPVHPAAGTAPAGPTATDRVDTGTVTSGAAGTGVRAARIAGPTAATGRRAGTRPAATSAAIVRGRTAPTIDGRVMPSARAIGMATTRTGAVALRRSAVAPGIAYAAMATGAPTAGQPATVTDSQVSAGPVSAATTAIGAVPTGSGPVAGMRIGCTGLPGTRL